MRTRIWLIFFLSTPPLAWAQQIVETGIKLYHTPSATEISVADIVQLSRKKQVIVFGEEHNDSLAHVLQNALYAALLDEYPQVILSMEMFERDVQLVLNEYLSGLIRERSFTKESRAWSNYADYAPLVQLAKSKAQQVIAANVPGRYASMVSQKGIGTLKQLPKAAKSYYSLFELPREDNPYRQKFYAAMGEHAHHMGPSIFHAQLLRDATMAESIVTTWKKNRKAKILHLTGKFHSDEGLGTVAAVKESKRGLDILTISCFPSDDFHAPNWEAHRDKADIIVLTDPNQPKTY
ncbi:Uncharacterized iron-regulated protein [Cyclobacterium xiamenense]|uniref:Uncharacterized iron-regulated protein n=1 Tax=Cyclobacterium xiamenense TaxID=1297121 RepID=A0A1H7ATT3_9BACT|nr:ChaN family lipoprotein [Cyclobacterium xiamenense]SEJ64455.1 Uncharacterized iron-regulated protein [Cyclobacterium xiamenense]